MNNPTLKPILDKYSISETEIIKIGDEILKNNLVIKYNYVPNDITTSDKKLKYNSQNFNWENDYGTSTNMAMLHLHALEPISYLLLAYHTSYKNDYLYKAFEILFDWYEHSQNGNHFYLWYRHCVADRAIVISELYLLKEKVNLDVSDLKKIYKLIFSHKNYLLQDQNFVKHNHGTLMDMGLIALAIVSEDNLAIKYSVSRLKENFLDTFTENMICVENSISYSVYNIEQFVKCQKYLLEPLEITLVDNFDNKIHQSLNFLSEIVQPDGAFPHLGDGEKLDIDYLKTLKLYEFYNNHVLFNNTGIVENISKVYYEEGYVILKRGSNYIFITAGDIKKNHKHADDLSFILYYDGEVFIDPGIYSYDNNAMRKYQTSARAHNTVVLNNETYQYIHNNPNEVGIIFLKEFDDYYYILMKNKSYDYADIFRHFYVLKSDFTILIQDEVFANNEVLASQFFNLSLSQYKGKKLNISDGQIIINKKIIINYDQGSFYELYNGNNPYNINALYSAKFHQFEPILKIGINKFGKNPRLTTTISKSINENLKIKTDSARSDKIYMNFNNNIVEFEKEEIAKYTDKQKSSSWIEITRKGNSINCITYAEYFEYQEYAWDIMKEGEKESVIWYQGNNSFEYTFENSGEYTLRYYVRNKYNHEQKKSYRSEQKIII